MNYYLYRNPYNTEYIIEVVNVDDYIYHYHGKILEIKNEFVGFDYPYKVGDMFLVSKNVCIKLDGPLVQR
jgi:hypothetical protein